LALFTDSPLAGLTIVVAPAILTNASSILSLGTANRLARVIDHTRVASAQLTRRASTGDSRAITERQLDRLEIRSDLLLRALRLFYISLGSFVTGADTPVNQSGVGANMATNVTSGKSLLPFRERTLLRHAVETAVASMCRPILVVIGADAELVSLELQSLPLLIA
jgi:hypothetical protein